MSIKKFLAVCVVLIALPVMAFAQDATVLSNGVQYAKTLVPNSKGQIVNPAAVNPQAWSANGASTGTPTTMPAGLGYFSTPATSSSNYSTGNISGALSAMGVQAMTDCANYVPTGDPVADQKCAAVNFLSRNCLSLSSSQSAILGSAGAGQSGGTNCQGTYGAGASQFGYNDAVKSTDSVFDVFKTASDEAGNTVGGTCAPQTVVTEPAQTEINTCVKVAPTDNPACSQYLRTTVSVSQTIQDAVNSCNGLTTNTNPLGVTGSCCNNTYASYAGSCTRVNTTSGTWLLNDDGKKQFWVPTGCPNPYNGLSLRGTFGLYFVGTITFQYCYYWPIKACPAGSTLSGNSCITTIKTATSSWDDQCQAYEQSSGITLGTP